MKIPSIYTRNSGTMKFDTAAKEYYFPRHTSISNRTATEYNVTSQDQWRVRETPLWEVQGTDSKVTK
jgi:hypothetical protein